MLAVRVRVSMLAVASTLGIASFVLNVVPIGIDPVATFYLPFTRAFELLAGAALARVGTTSARPARRAMSAPSQVWH